MDAIDLTAIKSRKELLNILVAQKMAGTVSEADADKVAEAIRRSWIASRKADPDVYERMVDDIRRSWTGSRCVGA